MLTTLVQLVESIYDILQFHHLRLSLVSVVLCMKETELSLSAIFMSMHLWWERLGLWHSGGEGLPSSLTTINKHFRSRFSWGWFIFGIDIWFHWHSWQWQLHLTCEVILVSPIAGNVSGHSSVINLEIQSDNWFISGLFVR